jgi:hypothetical protein
VAVAGPLAYWMARLAFFRQSPPSVPSPR